MEFISRDGETKRVASTTGHVFLVGKDPVSIPVSIETDAYAAGCIPVGSSPAVAVAEGPVMTDRVQIVFENMEMMIDRNKSGDITKQGLPNKTTLAELCGFSPSKKEYTTAWDKIKSEEE